MNNNGQNSESIFGDPISVYTRRQAIEDGVLVNLMQPETVGLVKEAGFRFPVAMTTTAFCATVTELESGYLQARTCKDAFGTCSGC